ncbi:alpha/beta hydrolase [Planctomycetota bacterium]
MNGRQARRLVMTVVGFLVFAYVVIMVTMYATQRRVMYPVPREVFMPELEGAELLKIDGGSDRTVYALYAPAPPEAPTVCHFHGNAEQLASAAAVFGQTLTQAGVGYYGVEYPGYGLAKEVGPPTETGLYEAAETALRHLHDTLGVPASTTVLLGCSLGSGVATEMARRGHGSRMILLAPYTSMVDMARTLLPFLPCGLLVRDRFDTASKAPGIDLPVLIVHGERDEVIPVSMGRKLAEVFPNAMLEILEDRGHNDVLFPDPSRLATRFAAFARGDAAPANAP